MSEAKRLEFEDWFKIGTKLYGDKIIKWKFVCPMCKTVQSAKDLLDCGVKREDLDKYIGFSCIGRFHEKGLPYMGKKKFKKFPHGCDWTLGGLFVGMGRDIIIIKDGKEQHRFDFADSYDTTVL